MIRGISMSIGALGVAWTLAGLGAISTHIQSGAMAETQKAEAIAQATEMGDAAIERAESAKTRAVEKHEEKIAKSQQKLQDAQDALTAVEEKFAPQLKEMEQEKLAAEESNNGRQLKRIESSIARLTRQRDSAARRPQAKVASAEEAVGAAQKRSAEATAKADEAISEANAAKTESIAAATSEATSISPRGGIVGPILGAVIGLALLGMGIMFGMRGAAPKKFVVEAPVRHVSRPKSPELTENVTTANIESERRTREPDPSGETIADLNSQIDDATAATPAMPVGTNGADPQITLPT